ncbi:hypothetical protein OESDEN_08486 [Oesophagostomum dentatum]|uniref:Uncharacterized protein n=1 Tax=Oesophagostomum dentatum TaxID=61180 RepID=A0A0B1T8I8_OESDE|nr:hypothetical protein OESDEN_08486 [Oesophagostomum dentatum]
MRLSNFEELEPCLSQDILLEEDEENIVSKSESGSPEEADPSIGLKPLATPTPPRNRKGLEPLYSTKERVTIRDATTAVIARLREKPRKDKYAVFGRHWIPGCQNRNLVMFLKLFLCLCCNV